MNKNERKNMLINKIDDNIKILTDMKKQIQYDNYDELILNANDMVDEYYFLVNQVKLLERY